ncbi:tellurite resistance/C4-dicarboxylate transporter family protein [Streptomyces sp. GSL17-113]|uniref:tellurite resistance/C4-dicarboxylate transporter family protein n=1 Tax=Streptomyces sp. GSL17-113 TaxID=3115365 RepID=UPI002E765E69|nr:tellurite resistance/C4-dicarboxylate transporter family protein [Streptomyces sp. GSL17-113]
MNGSPGDGGAAPRRGHRPPGAGMPPAAGAMVMATGILSIAFRTAGHWIVSLIALGIAVAAWLLLAADFARRLITARSRLEADAHTPAALTGVAATAVVGTRLALADLRPAAIALLVLATVLWPVVLTAVLRNRGRRMPGAVFLICVATQSIAVLAATLATTLRAGWLADAGLAVFCVGIVLYAEALLRFDPRQLRTGRGDHWVATGALAISALAAERLASSGHWAGGGVTVLDDLALALVAAALAGYAVLLVAEVRWPRPGADVRRWATVFPLGMTAQAVLAAPATLLHPLGRPLLWVAALAWLATAAMSVVLLRGTPERR